MNGKLAKWCRNQVYGTEFSPRARTYSTTNIKRFKKEILDPDKRKSWIEKGFAVLEDKMKNFLLWETSTLVADERRREYKLLKKKVK